VVQSCEYTQASRHGDLSLVEYMFNIIVFLPCSFRKGYEFVQEGEGVEQFFVIESPKKEVREINTQVTGVAQSV